MGRFKIDDSDEKGYKINKFNFNFYFLQTLPVSPNRYRPESVINNQTYLHSHTVLYTKILNLNEEI